MEQTKDTQAEFTRLMYDIATSQSLTLAQAVEQLKRDAHLRTIGETLARYAHIPADNTGAVLDFFLERLLSNSPSGTKRDTIRRKIQMWLNGDIQSISKQGAIQLSFALGLSPEDAGQFLHRTCGEGFHWRDPEELVFLFALREKMTYPEALALRDDLAEKKLLSPKNKDDSSLTGLVRQNAEHIASASELEEYLRQSQEQLGSLHNTAFSLFREYLNILCAPEINDLLYPDKKISVREVTAAYLHEALIPRFKKAVKGTTETQVLSALQRDIQQNWPDEVALSRMLHRKTDVTRKTLVLLFLATDGAVPCDGPHGELLEEDEDFESRYARLNATLCDCGFAPLDSRSPFDWMIIYCMCIEEAMFIDSQIEAFLSAIFLQEPSGPKES